MNITAVVPALNEEDHIEECLQALRNQTYPLDEIIVVDSGSEDRTVEISNVYADKVLQGIRNIGYNRSIGTLEARNDIILSTDADSIMPPWWVEGAVNQFLEDPETVLVIGSLKPMDTKFLSEAWCSLRNNFFPNTMERAACCLFRRPLIDMPWCGRDCKSWGEFTELKLNLRKSFPNGKWYYDQSLYILTDIPVEQQQITALTLGTVCASAAGLLLI